VVGVAAALEIISAIPLNRPPILFAAARAEPPLSLESASAIVNSQFRFLRAHDVLG
jgi:hypothetical protein